MDLRLLRLVLSRVVLFGSFLVFFLFGHGGDKSGMVYGQTSVPAPRPVSTTELVGAFYMPKQSSLTREWASFYKWNSEGGRGVTRWPLLGVYSGSDTEVMNWQIKWAVEHGVSLFVFDWYWSPQTLWSPSAQKPTWGLSIDSFLRASYSSSMQFSLYFTAVNLVANGQNSLDLARSETEIFHIFDYWSGHYFSRSNYLRIQNKPVVFIDYEGPFMKLGYPGILDRLRQRAQQKGYGGIYFVGMRPFGLGGNTDWYKGIVNSMSQATFDAVSSYGYFFAQNNSACSGYSSLMRDFSSQILTTTQGTATKFIPSFSVLFDSSPMSNSPFRCTDPRPNYFQDALSLVKNEVSSKASGAVNLGGKRLFLISSWNEWLEGSNIEPGIRLGYGGDDFSFLKTVRSVFSPGASGASQVPQLSRGPFSPGPFDLRPETSSRFIFTDQLTIDKWWVQDASSFVFTDGKYGRSFATPFYSSFSGKIQGNFIAWRGVSLQASTKPKVKIKFRSRCGFSFNQNCVVSAGLLSWISDQYVGPYYNSPLYSKYFISGSAVTLPEYSEYLLDLSSSSDWKGTIQEIRLRINFDNPPSRVDLEEVSFGTDLTPTPSLTPTPTRVPPTLTLTPTVTLTPAPILKKGVNVFSWPGFSETLLPSGCYSYLYHPQLSYWRTWVRDYGVSLGQSPSSRMSILCR